MRAATMILITLAILATGCTQPQPELQQSGDIRLTSPAFADGQPLPLPYSCYGSNVNPQLDIANTPSGTKSIALVLDDPDAPVTTWDHWIVWNLPPTTRIESGELPAGAVLGSNSWFKKEYGGPCPPLGQSHRYVFKLYALDTMLELQAGASKAQLEQAMQGHVLAQTKLTGTYSR